MIAEIVSLMLFFVADGLGQIPGTKLTFHVSDELFKTYTYSASVVTALALWVTRSLFPGESEGGGFWDFMLALFGKKRE